MISHETKPGTKVICMMFPRIHFVENGWIGWPLQPGTEYTVRKIVSLKSYGHQDQEWGVYLEEYVNGLVRVGYDIEFCYPLSMFNEAVVLPHSIMRFLHEPENQTVIE